MRKIAQEVTKAMNEQSRAARDVMKAAQNTTKLAGQVRKATAEQAKAALEITQDDRHDAQGGGRDVRARSPSRAVARDQIAKSAEQFTQAGRAAHPRDDGSVRAGGSR